MSGPDYSTFSLCSALTPLQPAPARSYPADPIQQHVAEDVIDGRICNVQRDDLPSSSVASDRPRERALTLSGPYQGQGQGGRTFAFPRRTDPADDAQGSMLCAQLGGFHFNSPYPHIDDAVNVPTAIMENPSWRSQHSLHYPTPVRGSMSQCIKGAGVGIPEDARTGLTTLHCDVSARVPTRRPSMAIPDRHIGTSYDFGLPSPCMAEDVGTFLPGGMITSPSPPPTAYHDDDVLGADHPHAFTFSERLPAMTRYEPAHYAFDRSTVPSLGGFAEASHPGIVSLDHCFAATVATPFTGYSSSHSPHDHPIYEHHPSFSTAIYAKELPRPGSAPPLIDNQVPFVGDARAALESPLEHAVAGDVHRGHGWYPHGVVPSPRSSPKRTGSIGHSCQKTPTGTRHLRRWSSVTHPALRASPPQLPGSRYPPSTDMAHFSPCSESESDDFAGYAHGATVELTEAPAESSTSVSAQPQPQSPPHLPQPARTVVRCDGCLIDADAWTAALARPDKLVHAYECFWDAAHPCGMWIEGDQSSVADHLALFHGFRGGEVTTKCLWRDCPKPHMKGTSIARHVVTHVGFRVKCPTCKHEFARVDACNRAHSRSGCLGVGQPTYGDLERVLDARKVDSSQRPSKKRRTDD